MVTAPELDRQVPLATIAAFAADGRVYRAFGHAIAADVGMVLLVPLARVDGDLAWLEDACPVPWDEVVGILEEPKVSTRPLPEWVTTIECRSLRALAPPPWDADFIALGPGRHQAHITRLLHPSGIHLAVLSARLPNNGDLWTEKLWRAN